MTGFKMPKTSAVAAAVSDIEEAKPTKELVVVEEPRRDHAESRFPAYHDKFFLQRKT